MFTDSWWGARELHGDVSAFLYGGQHHLDSYMRFGNLQVHVTDTTITYQFILLEGE